MKAKKVTGKISVEVYTDGKDNTRVDLLRSGSGCALLVGALKVVKSFAKNDLLNTLIEIHENVCLKEFIEETDSYSAVEEVEVADDFFEKKGGEDE